MSHDAAVSYDALVGAIREFTRYRAMLVRHLEREHRAATDAELRKLRALRQGWDRAYRVYVEAGSPSIPGLVQVLLPSSVKELEDEFGPIPSAPAASGGKPLEPVMAVEDARHLQEVIDVALNNGSQLVIARLADRFKVSRGRIRQAIALRKTGCDLSESPPAFRTVSDRDGMVRWPT